MKLQEILVILSAVLVLIIAENKDTKHEQDHLHEKSHHSKIQQEKHQDHHHILNRNKQFKSEHQRSSNHLRNFIYRDGNENGNCSWVCHDKNGKPSSNSLTLQVYYNGNAGLIAIVNKASSIALVIDGHINVSAIINGQSGSVTIIDINSKSVVHTSNPQAVDLKSNISVYIENGTSLEALLNIAKQSSEKYNFSAVTPSVLSDLSSLGWAHLCPEDDLKDITLLTSELKGPLASLYQDKGSFNIPNAQRFVSQNLAFAALLDNSQENLQSLHIQWDLERIFDASSGLEALLGFLSQIGKNVDLSKLLFKYLTSPENGLRLILNVSEGSDGIDGLITIIAKIIGVINGQGSVSEVINAVMNYNPNSEGNSSDLSQIIGETLELIRSQNTSFNNFPAFEGIYHILTALNNNNLVWNHINISDVIKLLRLENPRESMQAIMKIISDFVSSQGIPQFVQSALKGNISQILSNANVTEFLSRIPIFGDIIRRISSSIGNEFNIGRYLNSSSILDNFRNIIGGNFTGIPVVGNIISTVSKGMSEMESGIEHGVSGLLGSATGGFIGSASEHGTTSEPPSENPSISGSGSISTGSLQLNGSSSGVEHLPIEKTRSHGKKYINLHHSFQEKKLQHEHPHH